MAALLLILLLITLHYFSNHRSVLDTCSLHHSAYSPSKLSAPTIGKPARTLTKKIKKLKTLRLAILTSQLHTKEQRQSLHHFDSAQNHKHKNSSAPDNVWDLLTGILKFVGLIIVHQVTKYTLCVFEIKRAAQWLAEVFKWKINSLSFQ